MTKLRDDVVAIINTVIRPETLDTSDESRPLLELGLDSLDYATALMAIEDKYGISFAEEDMERLRSVREITAYIVEQGRG